jgi:hypothetical protein
MSFACKSSAKQRLRVSLREGIKGFTQVVVFITKFSGLQRETQRDREVPLVPVYSQNLETSVEVPGGMVQA